MGYLELLGRGDMATWWTAGAILFAYLVGGLGPRLKAYRPRRRKGGWTKPRAAPTARRPVPETRPSLSDPTEQLRIVMGATFERRRIMSPDEARVFMQVERAVKALNLSWRVMAQVSLGEIIKSPDPRAHSTINSKRVDILVISRRGEPLAAVEYQGSGHYLGTAAARDAVKKEALRRAGVRYIEVTPTHAREDITREIERLAEGEQRVAA